MNIRDIAARCGVSVATVSRVLNESPRVSPQTRQKVLRVLEEEHFIPNAFARGLGFNSMRMVGILCRDVANPFYGLAVSLLERNLRSNGFDTLLCCSGRELEDKKKCLALLLQKKVDAVILVGTAFREEKENQHIVEAALQVPIFLINAEIDIPGVYCVLCDEKQAMRDSVQTIAAAGHRDILYLHDMASWSWTGVQKLAGYRQGLADCGLTENEALIQLVPLDIESARAKVESLLKDGVAFTGIIASEDLLAVGALKALIQRKRETPIIGFNNSLIATCTIPSLTSVDNMLSLLCPQAVELLIRVLNGDKVPTKTTVPATLVERDTFRQHTA